MRSERWYWLLGFCGLSVCIHLWLMFRGQPFILPAKPAHTTEIEVALLSSPDMEATSTPRLHAASAHNAAQHPGAFIGLKQVGQLQTPLKPSLNSNVATAVNRVGKNPGGLDRLRQEKPLPLGTLTGKRDLEAPRLMQDRQTGALSAGNASLPLEPPSGGQGGRRALEALPENVIAPSGGTSNANLPNESAGSGGRSVLAITPLSTKDVSIAAKPGNGDGKTGIAGAATDESNSARLPTDNRVGKGTGYGQGNGPNVVSAAGVGAGDGPTGLTRGIPFGDVTGMLRGDSNGGGGSGTGAGGPGHGIIVHRAPGLRSLSGNRVHIVYLLDSSGSMVEGNKIGKAQQALRKALAELLPSDTFDVINFDKGVHYFAPDLLPATLPNLLNARNYVEHIQLDNWTFLSGALEAALAMEGVTQLFVLSDGEPHGGIEDFGELLAMVRERNRRHVQINTLALGLGEKFKGMVLLKALASENNGSYNYINLAK